MGRVFWKLDVDLLIDFSQCRFFLEFSVGFTFIDFGGFSFVELE